jgi:hypothetical protein
MAFSNATALSAEGARVGLVTCQECGAALLLDPRDDTNVLKLHDQWHDELAQRIFRASGRGRRA